MFPFTFSLPEKNAYKKQRGQGGKFDCSSTTQALTQTKQEAKDKCSGLVFSRKPSVGKDHSLLVINRKPSNLQHSELQFSIQSAGKANSIAQGEKNKYKATSVAAISFLYI